METRKTWARQIVLTNDLQDLRPTLFRITETKPYEEKGIYLRIDQDAIRKFTDQQQDLITPDCSTEALDMISLS